ncbi:MAG: hypothetical protein HC795_19150, partial [Coleofasciculaceae cyanobacterium RL_1_1]|nr:hypothetical protein [Coleofasciculaceae cyanobacterium RL_1_1]
MTVTLLDTIIALGGGQILATGSGNLETNDWILQADGTPIDLSAILANLSGDTVPLRLELAALSFGANVNTIELSSRGLGAIAANLDLTAAIEDGFADVRLDLADGILDLVGSTSAISLAALRSDLPVVWRGGRFELATTIDSLLMIAATQIIDGIALRGQADIGVGSG